MSRVVVVGAGLAGLAAAVRLADAGRDVSVLERLPRAGGRARRIAGPGRTPLDWGQHLMLGAYRAARKLADRLGTAHRLRFVEQPAPLVTGPGEVHTYALANLPAPLHALGALFGLRHLSLGDRLGLGLPALAAKLRARWRPERLDDLTAQQWLVANRQGPRAIRGFWEPLVVATCNAAPAETSAALLAAVLDQGFFASREDALPLLPDGTLDDVFVAPAVSAVAARGGRVRTGEEVVGLERGAGGRIAGVRTVRGEVLAADAVVLAVPPWALGPLLSDLPALSGAAADAAWLGAAPIVCVEAWYDRAWLSHPFAGLVGGAVQWAFAHGPGGVDGAAQRVSLVVSDARGWIGRSRAEVAAGAVEDVARFFPEARAARVAATAVVREPRATFFGRPGQARRRQGAVTAAAGLFLAGDATATGLPATIEGAVRSGEAAARAVLAAGPARR